MNRRAQPLCSLCRLKAQLQLSAPRRVYTYAPASKLSVVLVVVVDVVKLALNFPGFIGAARKPPRGDIRDELEGAGPPGYNTVTRVFPAPLSLIVRSL